MEVPVRTRILEATYACIARYGLAKTTMEDAAREAGLSRATVYRHFPGGREELVREVIAWETARFFIRLAESIAGVGDFTELLEEALLFAHEAIEQHELLQKMLQTEPERLVPTLTVESAKVKGLITAFLMPYLAGETHLKPGLDPAAAADYLARMLLSWIGSPGRWDLTDRAQVHTLVRTEFLAGILSSGGCT